MNKVSKQDIKQVTAYEYNGKRYKSLDTLANELAMKAGYNYYLRRQELTLDKYYTIGDTGSYLTQIRANIVVYKKKVKPIILKKLKEWFNEG